MNHQNASQAPHSSTGKQSTESPGAGSPFVRNMRIRLSWFCLGGLAAFLTVVLIYPPIRQVAIPYYPCLQTVVRTATGRSTFCRFSNALAATFQNLFSSAVQHMPMDDGGPASP